MRRYARRVASVPFALNTLSMLLEFEGANGGTTFIDSSSYGRTMNSYGSLTTSTTHFLIGGSSGYFSGASDGLYTAYASALDVGGGDFTLSMWIRPTSLSVNRTIIDFRGSGLYNTTGWILYFDSTGGLYVYDGLTGVSTSLGSSRKLVVNVWQHLAVTKSGTSVQGYINGTATGSAVTPSLSATNSTGLRVGLNQAGADLFIGYIDRLALLKGSVQATRDLALTVLLLHGSAFTDTSVSPKTITAVGSATTSTAQYPFAGGGTSFSIPGSTSGIQFWSGSATGGWLDMGSNCDVTIEFFVYFTATPSNSYLFAGGGANGFAIELVATNGTALNYRINGGSSSLGSLSLGNNTWHHIAMSRINGTMYVYLNGTRITAGIATGTQTFSTGSYRFGNSSGGGNGITGYMAECRIVRGQGIYSGATITVPTAPFPDP